MATLIDAVMATWAPDTRHYLTDTGQHIAVHVAAELNDFTAAAINESLQANGIPSLQSGIHQVVVEPTTIFECTPDGAAITLTPLASYPPGTSHDDAITQFKQET